MTVSTFPKPNNFRKDLPAKSLGVVETGISSKGVVEVGAASGTEGVVEVASAHVTKPVVPAVGAASGAEPVPRVGGSGTEHSTWSGSSQWHRGRG